jgi:hypothetical protein
MMLFNTRQDLVAKQVGAESILYDSTNKGIHVLNMTAAKIFQLCDGSHTPEEIAEALEGSFDGVDRVQAYKDVKRTLDVLEAKHLVVPKTNSDHLRR